MKNYKTIVAAGLEWMAEDFEVDGNIYFTYKEAIKNCPAGWRIPTINDFYELEFENKLNILSDNGVLINGTKSWNCPVYLVDVIFKSGNSGHFTFYVHNNRLYSEIFSEDVKIPVRYVKEKQAQ